VGYVVGKVRWGEERKGKVRSGKMITSRLLTALTVTLYTNYPVQNIQCKVSSSYYYNK